MFFRFDGRLGVQGFWAGFAAIGLALFTANALIAHEPVFARDWLAWALAAPLLYGLAAVCVKRLHDLGTSARWLALALAPPAAAFAFAGIARLSGADLDAIHNAARWTVHWGYGGLFVLTAGTLGLRVGDRNPNIYGPPPTQHEAQMGDDDTLTRETLEGAGSSA